MSDSLIASFNKLQTTLHFNAWQLFFKKSPPSYGLSFAQDISSVSPLEPPPLKLLLPTLDATGVMEATPASSLISSQSPSANPPLLNLILGYLIIGLAWGFTT